MSPPGFRGQITLSNETTPRMLQFLWQPFQQKLALDFPAVWNCGLHSCKIRMLIAINVAVEILAANAASHLV